MVRGSRRRMQRPSFRRRRGFGRQSTFRGIQRLTRAAVRGPSKRGSVFRQVRSLQSYVSGLKPEVKYTDTSLSSENVTTAGTVVHVTAIAQGDTIATRTGDQINVRSIDIRGSLDIPSGATPTAFGYYRVALVQDKQQVADTAPTAAAIFTSTAPEFLLPNVAALDRFKIIYLSQLFDPRMMVADTDFTSGVPPTQMPVFSFSWTGNIKVRYNGTAGTDIQKNGLFVVFLTSEGGNTVDFRGLCRVGFTDV